MNTIYETYETLKQRKGVRDSDVSKKTGLTSAYLSTWKKQRFCPKYERLKLLADYFGVPVNVFYEGIK